jgi:hypothetical protein
MFNKKKKHFEGNHKPHYTRQDGTVQNTLSDVPNANPPVSGQDLSADPAPVTAGETPVPPVKDDPVIYPFKTKADKMKTANNRNMPGPGSRYPAPGSSEPVDPDAPDYSISQNPNIDPNAVPVNSDGTVKICQICNMPIRSLNTAVHHKVSNELVHFDCALRELSKEFNPKLGRFKKIYYIGAGNFALVKEIYDRRGHLKSYEVIERIPYEPEEK